MATTTHTFDVTVEQDGAVHLSNVPVSAGQHVRVIVLVGQDVAEPQNRYPLRGRAYQFNDPYSPVMASDDWDPSL